MDLPRLLWNTAILIWLVVEAVRFDLAQFRRLGSRYFRWNRERWNFSDLEKQALGRFLAALILGLVGNAVISAIQFALEVMRQGGGGGGR